MKNHRTVLTSMVFKLLAPAGATAPVGVELRFESRNPYEVSLAFSAGSGGHVEWVLARDLLADGLMIDSGEGDVRVGPDASDPAVIVVSLSSPSGQATFEADAEQLVDFLNRTYDVVPPGKEHQWMSIDEALARMLPHDLY
ncbi:sporulation and cell division protein SsgA [Saccharopolyspora erythraea NRRL 2338]|uniref:Sporulation and cell division regulator protein n=2 Tax=Saccharopolyspora erythraea TaxID=1836 RepID=A4FKZ7_SACEN|nr:SsgA family sporulation/cell division regulator [Saccharopolyspora erythraea]EQD84131.1 sporulation protein SsgA [Saccharopolyspora erythraea D]PFG98361.1 sporulation and cell division protein SsgA [Saccharopolyspora erythraea NRRL 2338]QRK88432.1 SsgA family sporulation/cell division regulator [Saccharopolyspora erythraea]CAM04722.1 putative sporulation and cell division regulator protein [Saccharopolyspora erythraea NRRL 2338]